MEIRHVESFTITRSPKRGWTCTASDKNDPLVTARGTSPKAALAACLVVLAAT